MSMPMSMSMRQCVCISVCVCVTASLPRLQLLFFYVDTLLQIFTVLMILEFDYG